MRARVSGSSGHSARHYVAHAVRNLSQTRPRIVGVRVKLRAWTLGVSLHLRDGPTPRDIGPFRVRRARRPLPKTRDHAQTRGRDGCVHGWRHRGDVLVVAPGGCGREGAEPG